MTEYTLDLENGQTAKIEYSLGGSAEESNQMQLDHQHFQQLGSFQCISTLTVTLNEDVEEPLEFGFIANTITSQRIAYYNSSKKTKVMIAVPKQCLDGNGTEPPFAEASTKLPTKAGVHTIKIAYSDKPLCAFEREDKDAASEGNTLCKVEGSDVHKVWLAVGNPASGGLSLISSLGWTVDWSAEIAGEEVQINPETNGAGLKDLAEPKNPVTTGKLVNDSFKVIKTTWS